MRPLRAIGDPPELRNVDLITARLQVVAPDYVASDWVEVVMMEERFRHYLSEKHTSRDLPVAVDEPSRMLLIGAIEQLRDRVGHLHR